MNGGIYSTGNEIVDENAKLNISGNIIPQVWYRTIIRESGKPKDVQFVTDIHANARGCEEAVKSIIRAKQRKMRTA